jgi:hypothetical protein
MMIEVSTCTHRRDAGSNPTLSAARKLNQPFSTWRGVFLIILSVVV